MDGGYAKAGFLRKRKPESFGDYSFRQLDIAEKNKRRNFDNENTSIDTLYRMLCPVQKIGSVLGKGGSIVSAIRDETHAKIRVADRIPGAEERVVIVFSHPISESVERKLVRDSHINAGGMHFEPHCPAQAALLKVFDRIVEDDHSGGGNNNKNTEAEDFTIRLLVPHNQVGCLIGKAGDVIQKLRSGTRANIRILGEDHLPICAIASDELVQISGKSDVVKKALYEISSLLHQHPRKETPSVDDIIAASAQGLYPPGASNDPMVPHGAPIWPHEESEPLMAPRTSFFGRYGSELSKGADDHGMSSDFSLKVVCPSGKIGGVIGKGGSNVKQVEQQTGVRIHVEDNTDDSSIRIILISSREALFDRISPTIDAILQLQERASEISDKGDVITRLLVPSGKAGCLLGQGGQIINEMRKQTRADIRVCAKGDKPSYASSSEELVQITGNQRSSRDALCEIVLRLRERILRDANAAANYPLPAISHGFSTYDTISKTPGSSAYGDPNMKGHGSTFEDESYRAPPPVSGYSNIYSPVGARYTGSQVPSVYGAGVDNLYDTRQEYGARGRPPYEHSSDLYGPPERPSWSHRYDQRREDPWNSYLPRPYRSYGRD